MIRRATEAFWSILERFQQPRQKWHPCNPYFSINPNSQLAFYFDSSFRIWMNFFLHFKLINKFFQLHASPAEILHKIFLPKKRYANRSLIEPTGPIFISVVNIIRVWAQGHLCATTPRTQLNFNFLNHILLPFSRTTPEILKRCSGSNNPRAHPSQPINQKNR